MSKSTDLSKLSTWKNKGWLDTATAHDVVVNHDSLLESINDTYSNINTKGTHLISLVNILRSENKNNLADMNREKAVELLKETQDALKENKLSNEARIINPVKYEDLVKKYNELLKLFESGDISIKQHILLISLSLIVLQAPIRSEYVDMEIVFSDDKMS
eukprot:Lithocolla_globosa_v1_NODE_808_length_3237_cov_9.760876.p2 type:complete len:160 gc:universal NODE_808_length_3237_cov_9.760876:340-819(+)